MKKRGSKGKRSTKRAMKDLPATKTRTGDRQREIDQPRALMTSCR